MFQSIADDIKQQFTFGNRITRLIIFNTAVFVAANLVRLFFAVAAGMQHSGEFDNFLRYLSLSSDLVFDATHPWVFLTHMFLHVGFFHFLFNMLFLYWFGRIVGDFLGDHRIYPIYLLSGLAGGLLYLITAPLIGTSSMLFGASGAVMGIVVASGAIAPNYTMRLLFIGDVKLKYIVLVLVALDIFALGSMNNFGGHAAHIGGAIFGYIFVAMLKQGTDLSEPINGLFGWLQGLINGRPEQRTRKKPRSPIYVRHSDERARRRKGPRPKPASKREKDYQERLDEILDKIKQKGYESLSDEEKEFLFQASKK